MEERVSDESPRYRMEEMLMESIRRRNKAAQEIADRLGISIGRVFAEWRAAEERQRQWMRSLDAMGYKPGDDPVAFLRGINNPT